MHIRKEHERDSINSHSHCSHGPVDTTWGSLWLLRCQDSVGNWVLLHADRGQPSPSQLSHFVGRFFQPTKHFPGPRRTFGVTRCDEMWRVQWQDLAASGMLGASCDLSYNSSLFSRCQLWTVRLGSCRHSFKRQRLGGGAVSWNSRWRCQLAIPISPGFLVYWCLLMLTEFYWRFFVFLSNLTRTSHLRWGKVSSLRPRLVVTNASGALAPNIRRICLGIPCEIFRPPQRSCCPYRCGSFTSVLLLSWSMNHTLSYQLLVFLAGHVLCVSCEPTRIPEICDTFFDKLSLDEDSIRSAMSRLLMLNLDKIETDWDMQSVQALRSWSWTTETWWKCGGAECTAVQALSLAYFLQQQGPASWLAYNLEITRV